MRSFRAVALDLEMDGDRVLEIGLTEVDLNNWELGKTVSILIETPERVSEEVFKLTGLTQGRINKSGITMAEAYSKLITKYGFSNRLILVDSSDELGALDSHLCTYETMWHFNPEFYSFNNPDVLNVGSLYKIRFGEKNNTSLENMLKKFNIKHEEKFHRAGPDSRAIAKLALRLL